MQCVIKRKMNSCMHDISKVQWLTHALMSIAFLVTYGRRWDGWVISSQIRCSAVITQSLFSQIFTKTPHCLLARAMYGVSFVDPASNWYSGSVPVIIDVISYNIGPSNNDNRLYPCSYKYSSALELQNCRSLLLSVTEAQVMFLSKLISVNDSINYARRLFWWIINSQRAGKHGN